MVEKHAGTQHEPDQYADAVAKLEESEVTVDRPGAFKDFVVSNQIKLL